MSSDQVQISRSGDDYITEVTLDGSATMTETSFLIGNVSLVVIIYTLILISHRFSIRSYSKDQRHSLTE
jgi:hypothetical protein